MAKGTSSKEKIKNKILEVFPGSFLYDSGKEIRIPLMEDGCPVQIKVSLVCAKTNVDNGDDNAIPGADVGTTAPVAASNNFMNEPTAEEKENVKKLLEKLGITE